MDETPKNDNVPKYDKWQAVGLAWDLGYIIALPLVALGLLGKFLDNRFDTKPWLTLVGIIIAIVVTTFWLTVKIKKYIK